jgi:hypothetical protein
MCNNIYYESKKPKTTYNLKWREYVPLLKDKKISSFASLVDANMQSAACLERKEILPPPKYSL